MPDGSVVNDMPLEGVSRVVRQHDPVGGERVGTVATQLGLGGIVGEPAEDVIPDLGVTLPGEKVIRLHIRTVDASVCRAPATSRRVVPVGDVRVPTESDGRIAGWGIGLPAADYACGTQSGVSGTSAHGGIRLRDGVIAATRPDPRRRRGHGVIVPAVATTDVCAQHGRDVNGVRSPVEIPEQA